MCAKYLECKKRRRKTGGTFRHYCLVTKTKGVRSRKYLWKAKIHAVRRELEEARAMKRMKTALLSAMSNGRPGPLPKIPDYQRQLLKAAGFSLDGGMRVFRNKKNYYTTAAATVRLSMKDTEVREAIGTPEDLMRLEMAADSLQKSLSVHRSGCSYEVCLATIISDFLGKRRNAGP